MQIICFFMGLLMKDRNSKNRGSLKANQTAKIWISSVALSAFLLSSHPAFSQRETTSTPVDLTKLVKTSPDNDTASPSSSPEVTVTTSTVTETAPLASEDEDAATEEITQAASPIVTSTTSISVSSSLQTKDPSSIRLGSLGLDRDDVDGLGRLMWEGSDASTVLDLMNALDPALTPQALRPVLDHMMTARAVPPEGFIDIAPDIINAKLNWLAAKGASEDLAQMIRQLPENETWEDTKAWLILHDLMTRNDAAACRTAQKKVLVTLDALWHQINAFCAVINGDDMKAAFALDILEDSGVDDALYFGLMRYLTDGGEMVIENQDGLSLLNLVLMDSARLTIEADALKTLPQSYSSSVKSLRYLSPSASRLISARQFAGDASKDELAQAWALLPREELSSSEALTRLRFAQPQEDADLDNIALSRLNAWHAISAEKDDITKASLAFEAMIADYNLTGTEALQLWLPLIEGGINSAEIDAKIGPLMGFASAPTKVLMNESALAWNDVITLSARPLTSEHLFTAQAYDAIPLLEALGRPLSAIDWSASEALAPVLIQQGSALNFAALMQIENTADQGRKAEAVLQMAKLLQGVDLVTLNRDDAAQLIAVLMRLEMNETAKNLARDIMMSWAVDRHFKSINGGNTQNS